jgi:hypothetical protein
MAKNLAEVSAQAHGGGRDHLRQRFGIRHHHMALAAFEPALEVPPRLIINHARMVQSPDLRDLYEHVLVCFSVSSISSESIRVSFSG